jgi:pilus assembly protein CpaB
MRPKSLVLLALALGCGLVASIGISQVLDDSNRPTAVETTPIYVALQNINVGDPLTDEMVALEEWPKDKVPVGSLIKWEELEDRRPRTNIYKGEPILDTKLLAKGQTNDPIQATPSGMRLSTIQVDARKSAAGLLSPGDRVDLQLYVNRNEQQGITTPLTKIFLQNIRVFAVDQTVEKSADGEDSRAVAKTVSLLVTPRQANKISTAVNMGEVTLIPRNPDDESIIDDAEESAEGIFERSTAGSRAREQETEDNGEDSGPLSGLRELMESAMAASAAQAGVAAAQPVEATAPPFEMTIIFPTAVERIQFEGGRPILPDTHEQNLTTMTSVNPLLPVAPAEAPAADETGGSEESPEDGETPDGFPIDFQLK